jgi:hypothetical protein
MWNERNDLRTVSLPLIGATHHGALLFARQPNGSLAGVQSRELLDAKLVRDVSQIAVS